MTKHRFALRVMYSRSDSDKGKDKLVDEKPIFGTEDPEDEPLDEKEVKLSIYKGVEGNEERLKKRREDDEWDLHMKCTQEWFIRCSWINKFVFLEALCKSTSGCLVLEGVLKGIDSIFSKDVIESVAHNLSNYDYDIIPSDDNRALDLNQVQESMDRDYLWFSTLESSRKISVLLRLLRLGGGGLVYNIYKVIDKLFKERNETKSSSLARLSSETGKQIDEMKLKVKIQSKTQTNKQPVEERSIENRLSGLDEITQRKLEQLARRDAELTEYKKMRGLTTEPNKNAKKVEVRETVDYFQILPIWLNRRIMSYIDEKTLSGLKKVGKYWGKMIDDYLNEKSGRKAINGKINRIIGMRPGKEMENVEEVEDEMEEEEEEKDKLESFEFVVELGKREFLKKKNIHERYLSRQVEACKKRFSKKFLVTPIESSVFYERLCTLNASVGMLAASTPNNIIHFYSVRTGKRLSFSVFGLESTVTCLALHEDNIHIFVGCKDGSLIAKNMRTNRSVTSFIGHSSAIKWLFATSSSLLSVSQDGIIRSFQIWSGFCLLCVDMSLLKWTVSSLSVWRDKPFWLIMGTDEGVLLVADVERRTFVTQAKLHNGKITQLAQDEELLITGSENGKIRVWDVTKLDNNCDVLKPFYDVNVESAVTSLTLYKNLVYSGCENGSIKIFFLLEGIILKVWKIAKETPVLGLAAVEDKLHMKLIIWHEGGIEMRVIQTRKTKGLTKLIREQTKKEKETEEELRAPVTTAERLVEAKGNPYSKKENSFGMKKPLKDRCCTVLALRSVKRDVCPRREDIVTKALKALQKRTPLSANSILEK